MLFKQLSTLFIITSLLFGCTTTQHGKGIILAEETIMTQGYKPHTKKNITTIMSSGAVMGSTTLAVILAAGGDVLASESLIVIGATTGYGVLASLGGITLFELYRYTTHPSKTYRLTVQSLTTTETHKTFSIEQHYPRYPLKTEVKIIERNGVFFVRKLGST